MLPYPNLKNATKVHITDIENQGELISGYESGFNSVLYSPSNIVDIRQFRQLN